MPLPLYHIVSGHIGLASATPLGDFLWYLTRRLCILPLPCLAGSQRDHTAVGIGERPIVVS